MSYLKLYRDWARFRLSHRIMTQSAASWLVLWYYGRLLIKALPFRVDCRFEFNTTDGHSRTSRHGFDTDLRCFDCKLDNTNCLSNYKVQYGKRLLGTVQWFRKWAPLGETGIVKGFIDLPVKLEPILLAKLFSAVYKLDYSNYFFEISSGILLQIRSNR